MIEINTIIRKKFGSSISRRIRKNNKIPAIVYGFRKYNLGITVEHDNFLNFFKIPDFYTSIITLVIDNKKYLVKIKDLHWHVFKTKILHIDFFLVN